MATTRGVKEIEPDEVVIRVMRALAVDQVVETIHGIDHSEVTPSNTLRVGQGV